MQVGIALFGAVFAVWFFSYSAQVEDFKPPLRRNVYNDINSKANDSTAYCDKHDGMYKMTVEVLDPASNDTGGSWHSPRLVMGPKTVGTGGCESAGKPGRNRRREQDGEYLT